MHMALIEAGTYLDFINPVPFSGPEGVIESGVLNEAGRISGRAQAAVRPISVSDFNRIVSIGVEEHDFELPRIDEQLSYSNGFSEGSQEPIVFDEQRDRIMQFSSRIVRDRLFRSLFLKACDKRCAITGLKLINGGGRAEVDAAHIKPVEANGPDILTNGIAQSGTAHWMFDRGLISLSDELDILVSRQANDADSIRGLINPTGRAIVPLRPYERPNPQFLHWHRENCFKH
jgi:putative restriction endonuclease